MPNQKEYWFSCRNRYTCMPNCNCMHPLAKNIESHDLGFPTTFECITTTLAGVSRACDFHVVKALSWPKNWYLTRAISSFQPHLDWYEQLQIGWKIHGNWGTSHLQHFGSNGDSLLIQILPTYKATLSPQTWSTCCKRGTHALELTQTLAFTNFSTSEPYSDTLKSNTSSNPGIW